MGPDAPIQKTEVVHPGPGVSRTTGRKHAVWAGSPGSLVIYHHGTRLSPWAPGHLAGGMSGDERGEGQGLVHSRSVGVVRGPSENGVVPVLPHSGRP